MSNRLSIDLEYNKNSDGVIISSNDSEFIHTYGQYILVSKTSLFDYMEQLEYWAKEFGYSCIFKIPVEE